MSSLVNLPSIKYKVSSVLNKNTKQFGKIFLFDGDEETCWNSDQGDEQWVMFKFDEPVIINSDDQISLHVQFQGGFSCSSSVVTFTTEDGCKLNASKCFPADSNAKQSFTLNVSDLPKDSPPFAASIMKVTFSEPTDFFGRMIVYSLDLIHERK